MIKSVLKAISILRLFSETETRLTLTEISGYLDIPKSTAHNLLKTLLSEGFIEKVNGDEYALGPTPLVLTQNIRVNVEIRDPAAPLLRQLAESTHESVMLTVRDGNSVLYIYAIESPQRLLARTAIGARAPMHCTAVGKAILANLPEDEVNKFGKEVDLVAYTNSTITDFNDLKAELEKTRSRRYALDCGEHESGTFCIGAPILDRKGDVIAACSLSGTDPEIHDERLEELSGLVLQAAHEISRRMGYVPSPVYR